ncbi:MAG: 3-deoxy-7-phosphoheptulonate synthase [Bacteroidetes bacterium]|jgi:3-deoxy-7-phosphoheptulonate synthase|nr:3-deoxy-7-phosphoheptulonate synthase [Bacteroidota bacterium]
MIVVTTPHATEHDIEAIIKFLTEHGFDIHRSTGVQHTVIGAIGVQPDFDHRQVELLPGVAEVVRISDPYKLASRAFREEGTVIPIGSVEVGRDPVVVMAGPCSVESEEQIHIIAKRVKAAGATVLRGGAFKPRTSPYAFQGLGEEGLTFMRQAADAHGLAVITEVMDRSQIDMVERYSDILQVGARNMQNYTFLRDLGKASKPVMLKRGLSATIEEWLMSAEYILSGGNHNVMLCERGIRTFEPSTRNTMDIGAIPLVKKRSHLPIIADPSHGIGLRDKVIPMARAAVAAGADGIMVEVHHDPDHAKSDGAQSLFPDQFEQLMREVKIIAEAIGRRIA